MTARQASPEALAPDSNATIAALLGPSRRAERSLTDHMIRGSFLMIAWRWGVRAIGLVSTLVLARLLTPEDFGIIAMAMIIVGLLEILSYTGQSAALIRTPNLTRAHLDSAWTVQVLIGICICLSTAFCAPFGPLLFGEPRVEAVIYVMALRALLNGFVNIGIVGFRINFDFAKDFRFGIYEKLLSFLVLLGLALWLQNYWALAIGVVVAKLISIGLSYTMHSYRPRFDLSRVREIWSYSSWLLTMQVANFLATKIDEFIVGNRAGTTSMGHYSVSADIATAPTLELVQPAWRAIFPIYTSISNDTVRFQRTFLSVLSATTIMALPLAIGTSLIADDFVHVALGSQWTEAAAFVRWLAPSAAALVIAEAIITILNVQARPSLGTFVVILRTILLIIGSIIGFLWAGVLGVAIARTLTLFAALPFFFIAVRRVLNIRIAQVITRLWRPIVASATMMIAVQAMHPLLTDVPAVRLLIDTMWGGLVYCSMILILWSLSGRSEGLEELFVRKILSLRHRQR